VLAADHVANAPDSHSEGKARSEGIEVPQVKARSGDVDADRQGPEDQRTVEGEAARPKPCPRLHQAVRIVEEEVKEARTDDPGERNQDDERQERLDRQPTLARVSPREKTPKPIPPRSSARARRLRAGRGGSAGRRSA
jgi:hypothetical protein